MQIRNYRELKNRVVWFVIVASLMLCSMILMSRTLRAQNDLGRQTVAITYPLDETVKVRFRGTTRLPRLKGEAKVKRTGRRNTRVELSIENVPRATELGEPYTTYILWAISPEGRIDNLGEIKRSGSFLFDSKIDVTTPLQTFALIVTAEPHFLVRAPSRLVVLENLPPANPGEATAATVDVQYIGNTSDYFDSGTVPEVADRDYQKTPVSLLGARQAVSLAKYAGAGRDAVDELKQATAELENAENAWRAKQPESDVDGLARNATSLGARAEETALSRKSARERREEVARRDAALRTVERDAADTADELTKTKTELERERRERELVERDRTNLTEQLREQRAEVARLRDELQQTRGAADEARVRLARIEGERQAEENRRTQFQQQQNQQNAVGELRAALARFGTVREAANGFLVLTLPDSSFAGARTAQLTAAAQTKLNQLAALLAANPDFAARIEAHADSRGDAAQLQQLTEERARVVAQLMINAGVDGSRVEANGLGTSNPIAANTTVATRARNRRVDITFMPRPPEVQSTAAPSGATTNQ